MSGPCIINLGLYRTGTSTFAKAWSECGKRAWRKFPDLEPWQHRKMIMNPRALVCDWWCQDGGRDEVIELVKSYDIVCDGWMPLLAFLPPEELQDLVSNASRDILFVCTNRPTHELVISELHHWVIHDLNRHLNTDEIAQLADLLSERASEHAAAVNALRLDYSVLDLPLNQINNWELLLQSQIPDGIRDETTTFTAKLKAIGKQNANPELPVEGVLLTMRIGQPENIKGLFQLLDSLEEDKLCKYLLVLALDEDEAGTDKAKKLQLLLEDRKQYGHMVSMHILTNPAKPEGEPFRICKVWDRMAMVAWEQGAKWVTLLGDDVTIHCKYHYRAIYRRFLDLEIMGFPRWFGCPWYNDSTFPGFPTFPVVGAVHREVFGGLIPQKRESCFVNQDLDPYLQRLYLKFGASPFMKDVHLSNGKGGSDTNPTRYDRRGAFGWRDWVLQDVDCIEQYLKTAHEMTLVPSKILLDVVVPTYRINIDLLKGICSLKVPEDMRASFIVIVDNPELLLETMEEKNLGNACAALEHELAHSGGNNVRVRCNSENIGASGSRNRGMDESAAEYILFLDDDVIPKPDLLQKYGAYIKKWMVRETDTKEPLHGLVGKVEFPRHPEMPLRHAAVLMSYLTFMFEIASNDIYEHPAWGVTANLLISRKVNSVRFDTRYAKTGGGEDVDFCLRLGGRLRSAPDAGVAHDFWEGPSWKLSQHFFKWAIGDSALFTSQHGASHCYRSFPNVVEFLFLAALPMIWWKGLVGFILLVLVCFAGDCAVDMVDTEAFSHRAKLLEYHRSIWFCLAAHILANLYVVILECGRLKGHLTRGEVKNITMRFDWHCGRLEHAQSAFRRMELYKFIIFCGGLASVLVIDARAMIPMAYMGEKA